MLRTILNLANREAVVRKQLAVTVIALAVSFIGCKPIHRKQESDGKSLRIANSAAKILKQIANRQARSISMISVKITPRQVLDFAGSLTDNQFSIVRNISSEQLELIHKLNRDHLFEISSRDRIYGGYRKMLQEDYDKAKGRVMMSSEQVELISELGSEQIDQLRKLTPKQLHTLNVMHPAQLDVIRNKETLEEIREIVEAEGVLRIIKAVNEINPANN